MLSENADPLAGLDPATVFGAVATEKTIGLAVSGGADSLALMLLVAAWPGRPRAIVYTLDHGLRPEAAREAAMVVAEAERLGLEARALRWEGEKPDTGRQEAARAARYRVIGAAMRADGARVLLTAHHRRDQAETVLMRMAHGSGVAGLGGMRKRAEVTGVPLFRPLLDVAPETLAAIVSRAGLVPVQDPSNGDPAYERTRWRQALPDLAALGLTEERIGRFAERLQRMDALADAATDAFLAQNARLDALGVVHMSRAALVTAQPEIAIRAMSRAIETVSGQRCNALGQIERLCGGLSASAAAAETLSGAVVHPRAKTLLVYREAGRMGVSQARLIKGEVAPFDDRFTLTPNADGLIVCPATGWTRERFEDWAGQGLEIPVAALAACPIVTAPDGAIVAVGGLVRGDAVAIALHPLTDRR